MTAQTFHDYLEAQADRDDALGDLARDYAEAIRRGEHGPVRDHHELHRILNARHAPGYVHDAVDAAHLDHGHDRHCAIPARDPRPRPVVPPPEPCERCRARDLADDPDAPSSRHDCDCAEVTR